MDVAGYRAVRVHPAAQPGVCHAAAQEVAVGEALGFKVVTFYWLTDVVDYEEVVALHRQWVADRAYDVRGRIYINQQGINAQLSAPADQAVEYAQWVTQVRLLNSSHSSGTPVGWGVLPFAGLVRWV